MRIDSKSIAYLFVYQSDLLMTGSNYRG